ncbi:MAG TPA: PilN domain-containing protein [Thermodesulfovibrionales bacterium]|nr:PilN domain-containing protein [Thermodesulfovibrionales bacterium]
MIRVNLLPVKRKKKAKPVPAFMVTIVLITVLVICALAYLFYYYNSALQATQNRFDSNTKKIAELKDKIKEVDNFEKLNKTIEDRTKIIEQLRKNQNIPVMMLDEISRNLPKGVWLNSMAVAGAGSNVDIEGYAFTNADVVAFVDNLKSSKLLTEIYLQESKQAEIEKITLYQFKLTCKVAG